jgi:sugar O-acyltransferase (sialic acid O-acetyltransferase NeuD family)
VIGAGGFGREVVDLVRDVGRAGTAYDLLGLLGDAGPDAGVLDRLGVAWLGPVADLADLPRGTAYVVAVADARARERLAAQADAGGHEAVTLVHPSAVVGTDVRMSSGVVVAAHCSLTSNVALGAHVHVDRACTVGRDAVLEDFVRLNPGAVVSGGVTIRRGATLGTGAVTRQGVEIGAGTYVGAGAAVVTDLPPGVIAVGVPARVTRDVGDGG